MKYHYKQIQELEDRLLKLETELGAIAATLSRLESRMEQRALYSLYDRRASLAPYEGPERRALVTTFGDLEQEH